MDIDDIELRHLRYFLAVADELHFGRAAERLGMAQPPLSQQIQRLESLLGHALFVRKPSVRLTAAGHSLLGVARRAIGEVRHGLEEVARTGSGEIGNLTVAFPASTLLTPLASTIRRYRERHPRIELRLRELPTADQQAALLDGSVDVGFTRQGRSDDRLRSETLLREPFLVALPPRHPLRARRRVPLRALASEPFIQFPHAVAPGLHEQVIALCAGAGFTPNVVQESREWLTIVGLVEAGLGLSLVPASFKRLRWGGVSYRPLGADATTTIELSWADAPRPTVAGFVEIARQTFAR